MQHISRINKKNTFKYEEIIMCLVFLQLNYVTNIMIFLQNKEIKKAQTIAEYIIYFLPALIKGKLH